VSELRPNGLFLATVSDFEMGNRSSSFGASAVARGRSECRLALGWRHPFVGPNSAGSERRRSSFHAAGIKAVETTYREALAASAA